MPRFVILRHQLPSGDSHWDVMLEGDRALLTWSISEIPDDDHPVVAQRLTDHRLVYLDYEGSVSGDRGYVRRWDWGTYESLQSSDGELVVRLHGHRLNGRCSFRRMDDSQRWALTLACRDFSD